MDITVEPRAPELRCYKCSSSRVSALCHHCWRPRCGKHVLPSPPWARKLFGREGEGPGLKAVHACHCGDCAHTRTGTSEAASRWLSVAAACAILAATGLIVAVWLSLIVGLAIFLAGGLAAAWACFRVRFTWAQLLTGDARAATPQDRRRSIDRATPRRDYPQVTRSRVSDRAGSSHGNNQHDPYLWLA